MPIEVWLTADPTQDTAGKQLGYLAFWSIDEPGLILGSSVRQGQRSVIYPTQAEAWSAAEEAATQASHDTVVVRDRR